MTYDFLVAARINIFFPYKLKCNTRIFQVRSGRYMCNIYLKYLCPNENLVANFLEQTAFQHVIKYFISSGGKNKNANSTINSVVFWPRLEFRVVSSRFESFRGNQSAESSVHLTWKSHHFVVIIEL